MWCNILIFTKEDEQRVCCREGMSEWEDDCMDMRKKRLVDEHRCMKRWVDECDKIKKETTGKFNPEWDK